MICSRCKKVIPDGSVQCPECGADLKSSIKKAKTKKGCMWAFIIAVIVFSILVMALIISTGNDSSTDNSGNTTTTTVQNVSDKDKKSVTEATVSKEYQNALKKAKSYSNFMYMSKKKIYEQLTSEYGEQFPADAAQYAIDNLQADYKYNALQKAKSYQTNMSMSKSAIYDQLVSEYGENFTAEEAQYAIDNLPD